LFDKSNVKHTYEKNGGFAIKVATALPIAMSIYNSS